MLVLLFVVCSNVIKAQVGERRNDLSVGVNAGMTMTQMTFEPKIKQNMKSSQHLVLQQDMFVRNTSQVFVQFNWS